MQAMLPEGFPFYQFNTLFKIYFYDIKMDICDIGVYDQFCYIPVKRVRPIRGSALVHIN